MKSKKSIQKTLFSSFAGLAGVSLFLLGNPISVLAQNYQNDFSRFETTSQLESSFSESVLQNSSFSSFSSFSLFSKKEIKDTDMEISPWEKRIGITGAFGEGATSMTLGFSHLYGFGSSRRFKLGYGVRLSSFFGSDREFTAAPPDLASEDNPQIFTPESSQTNAINLGIYTDYSITENVLIGFNIDLVGFSFGAEKEGGVVVEPALTPASFPDTAKPTSFNALLIGDNDLGTLNSEFWIGYRIASNVMVRGAFSYLFTEYTTEEKYQDDNDRFRYKAAQGAVGISYTF